MSEMSSDRSQAKAALKRGSISQSAYDKLMVKMDRVSAAKPVAKAEEKREGDKRKDSPKEEASEDPNSGDMSDGADGASKDQFYKGGKGK